LTGGHAAVTTAGDTALGVPLDTPPRGWRLQNINDAKGVMARLLAGEPVMIDGTAPWLPTTRLPVVPAATLRLVFTERAVKGDADTLVYHPCRLAIGVGASRGCPPEELIALVRGALAEADLAEGAVAVVTSLDLKADEPAMQAAADTLGVPFRVFSAEALEAETPRLANPSGVVFAEVGCHGVAEGAALAAAGPEGSLVVGKRKSANATVAIARAPAPLDPKTVGRSRGRLAVI